MTILLIKPFIIGFYNDLFRIGQLTPPTWPTYPVLGVSWPIRHLSQKYSAISSIVNIKA